MTATRKKKAAKKPSRRKATPRRSAKRKAPVRKKAPKRKAAAKKKRPAAKRKAASKKAPASGIKAGSIDSMTKSTTALKFAARKRRRSQWTDFIKECLDLGFDHTQVVQVPKGRDPKAFRVRVSAVVSKEVRPHREDAKFRCRLTADEKHVGVTCEEL